jgi:hypothetical protein
MQHDCEGHPGDAYLGHADGGVDRPCAGYDWAEDDRPETYTGRFAKAAPVRVSLAARSAELCGFALEGGFPAGSGGLAVEACRAVGFAGFGLGAGRGVGELFAQGLELLFFRAEACLAGRKRLWRDVGHGGILPRIGGEGCRESRRASYRTVSRRGL